MPRICSVMDNPPIIHCYPDLDQTNSTFSRCLIMGGKPTNCTDGIFYSEGDKKYVTFCHGIELWLPLVVTCTTIIIALLLTLPLTFWLNNLLDPVKLTIMSKKLLGCCLQNPSGYLPPVWNGDEEIAIAHRFRCGGHGMPHEFSSRRVDERDTRVKER